MAAADAKPRVLLISLEFQPFFDDSHAPLIDAISDRAKLQRVKTADSALRQLEATATTQAPHAVLITDAALANDPKHARVWDAVLAYVRSGGSAVVMGHFSSFVKPVKVPKFFAKAGLPWKAGSYHRTDTVLNRAAIAPAALADSLPQSYSQKALSVSNVAAEHVWYGSSPDSVVQSMVFPATNAHTPGEAAVALAAVGNGKLGYLGDVNAEEGSFAAILGMCSLL